MVRVKEFFKSLKWYDYVIISSLIIATLTLGLVFHSDAITILSAIMGAFGVFFIAKGSVAGQFFIIIKAIFYSIISFMNKFYGEVIISCAISIPICLATIIMWFRNLDSPNGQIKIRRKMTWKEFLIASFVCVAISVGIYFFLEHFNTRFCILSTFAFFFSLIGSYLSLRRCEYNFIFFIINNILCITMWLLLVITDNNVSQIITFVSYLINFTTNIFGIFIWIKLKKKQGEKNDGTSCTSGKL